MIKPSANSGKNITITIGSVNYDRLPIKTHVVSKVDKIDNLLDRYAKSKLKKNDLLIISERIIAIIEGRSYPITSIHPGWWARRLYKFVTSHPGGIGLRSPHTMQLALDEAGLPRILFAAAVSAVTKPFGLKGIFYHAVGNNINAIDGPCDYTLPPGNKSAKLGPKNPQKTADEISELYSVDTAIIDANDYGVRILGYSKNVNPKFIEKLFADNPLGQSDEQTPIAIVRRHGKQ